MPGARRHGRVGRGDRRRPRRIEIRDTSVPCTCAIQRGSAGRSARTTARLRATFAGSSPLRRPRLSDPYSPLLTPPSRVVTNARTRGGAGQSGTIHAARHHLRSACEEAAKSAGSGASNATALPVRGWIERELPRVQRLAREERLRARPRRPDRPRGDGRSRRGARGSGACVPSPGGTRAACARAKRLAHAVVRDRGLAAR